MFSDEYLTRCGSPKFWSNRRQPTVGDWYFDLESQRWWVLSKPEDFADVPESAFFVPDLDDLLELLGSRIRLLGVDPDEAELKMTLKGRQAEVQVSLPDGTFSMAGPHESLHSSLFHMMQQLVAQAALRRLYGRRPPAAAG